MGDGGGGRTPASSLADAVRVGGAEEVQDYDARGVWARSLATTTGATELTWLLVDAGGSLAEHAAGRDQLFVVVEGSGWLEVDNDRRALGVGDAAVVRAGQRHAKGSAPGMVALIIQAPWLEAG